MKTYNYSLGWKKCSIGLVDAPWWACLIFWIADNLTREWMNKIKLPNWPKMKWKYSDGEKYTPYEWLGSLGDLVFYGIAGRIFDWYYKKEYENGWEKTIEVSYEVLKENFYADNKEFFDIHESVLRDE